MGRMRDIGAFRRGQIVAMHAEGHSQVFISQQLKISRCAVQNAIKAGRPICNRKNCGRKRKTTPRDDRVLKQVVTSSPHTSAARLVQVLKERGTNISQSTVRRRLSKEFNLVARRPPRFHW
jgi:transposase